MKMNYFAIACTKRVWGLTNFDDCKTDKKMGFLNIRDF